jgi:hypothetical protein
MRLPYSFPFVFLASWVFWPFGPRPKDGVRFGLGLGCERGISVAPSSQVAEGAETVLNLGGLLRREFRFAFLVDRFSRPMLDGA